MIFMLRAGLDWSRLLLPVVFVTFSCCGLVSADHHHDAGQDYRRLLNQYPEVGTNCSHLKFLGRGLVSAGIGWSLLVFCMLFLLLAGLGWFRLVSDGFSACFCGSFLLWAGLGWSRLVLADLNGRFF